MVKLNDLIDFARRNAVWFAFVAVVLSSCGGASNAPTAPVVRQTTVQVFDGTVDKYEDGANGVVCYILRDVGVLHDMKNIGTTATYPAVAISCVQVTEADNGK